MTLDMEVLARTRGRRPRSGIQSHAVCAYAGAGSTGAIDRPTSEAEGIWLHIVRA